MSVSKSSLLEQAIEQPVDFDLVQLIRVINRHLAISKQTFDLVIEADPMPDNGAPQVTDFQWRDSNATIVSNESSLTSGDATVPLYIYEALLSAFHQEDYALTDFLNILNNSYFKVFARTVEKSHLLLSDEFDRFFHHHSQQHKQRAQLSHCIAQISGLPNTNQAQRWLGYSLMLGRPNRSKNDLQQVLTDYFSLNISITCSSISKHQLTKDNWTRLGKEKSLATQESLCGQNNILGQGFLLGQRCWLSKQKINITVEPDNAEQLTQLTSDSAWYLELAQMTRYYLRDKTEIAILLKAPDSWFARTKLSSKSHETICLGRGFHIKSSQQDTPIVYLIHLVKD